MTELRALGVSVQLPSGWEGRIFRRPEHGELTATANEPAAPEGARTYAIAHVSTIELPPDVGDFASGAVDRLGATDALVVLFEYGPESVGTPLFALDGMPRLLDPDDFSPGVLQRSLPGQAGLQVFFHERGRAFCLYVVLGAYSRRRDVVPLVNDVLASFDLS